MYPCFTNVETNMKS